MPEKPSEVVLLRQVSDIIHTLRGQQVIMDEDLATLYGVQTGRLNEAVKRNSERFPPDFMFQLSADEWNSLKSQIAISNAGRGGRRKLPYAFTQEGVAMLSGVLGSPRAVQVNIEIMRAFVRYRHLIVSQGDLATKLVEVEKQLGGRLDRHDEKFRMLTTAVRMLRDEIKQHPPAPQPEMKPKRRIGFNREDET